MYWLTSRAVGGVSGLAEHASDAKVTAGVDCGREPVGLTLHLSVEAGEVGLVEDFLDLYRVGVIVQDRWMVLSVKTLTQGVNTSQSLTRHEVAAQARGSVCLANVDVEVRDGERTFLDAATARTTPAVEHVRHRFGEVRRKIKVLPVAAETFGVGEQDCVVDRRGQVVVRLRVQRPVPVPSYS